MHVLQDTLSNKTYHFPALGRAPEVSTRTQKLKATVCLAEDFPLSLQEQIMPIIDLMVTLRSTLTFT